MTHNLEVYRKAINFLMNLDQALTEEERDLLLNILEEAKRCLPPELLKGLQEVSLELFQAMATDEDKTKDSYLRDL